MLKIRMIAFRWGGPAMEHLRLSYYPDITQHRTSKEVREAVERFAQALGDELSKLRGRIAFIEVLPVLSVREQTAMAAQARCEIALMKPASYIFARRRNRLVDVGAVALRKIDGRIGDTYFAQVYAHRRTGIRNFEELRAACRQPLEHRPRMGFGDSFSTSNFLVNAALLKDNGVHPLTRFRTVQFFGGHERVAKAVYEDLADVGAGHDGAIVDLARQPGFSDAEDEMVRIGRRDIHSDPVVLIVEDDALKADMVRALLSIEALPDVKQALDIFWGAVFGLGPTRHENYRSIEESIDSLGIPEADILGE